MMDEIVSVSARGIDRALRSGLGHFDSGEYEQALAVFDDAILRYGPDMGLYRWKGVTLRHLGRVNEAIRALELAATETTTDSLYELALLLIEENVDPPRGMELLNGLSANGDMPAREYLAHQAYEEGRFGDVVTLARAAQPETARDEWPDCVECLETMEGIALTEMGQLEAARFHQKRASKKNPTCASHLTNLGRVYQLQKRYPRALKCYLSAMETDPDDPIPQINLAHLYEEMGRIDAARNIFQAQYASSDPEQPDMAILEDYARFLARHGDLDQAVKLVERTMQQAQGEPRDDLAAFLGWLAMDGGDTGRARAIWEEQVTRRPLAFAARHYLAGLYSQEGQTEQALILLEEAHALDPIGTRNWCVRPDGKVETCFENIAAHPRFITVAGLDNRLEG